MLAAVLRFLVVAALVVAALVVAVFGLVEPASTTAAAAATASVAAPAGDKRVVKSLNDVEGRKAPKPSSAAVEVPISFAVAVVAASVAEVAGAGMG